MIMLLKQNGWMKIAAVFLIICLILGFSDFLAPETVSAAESLVTIKVDGEVCKTFTSEELEELQREEYYTYSAINTWPTKSWYIGQGPTLASLLANLEMPKGLRLGDIQLIKFKARDGLQLTFTKEELLGDTRYYFPGLKENHEYFGYIPGSPEGALEVPTVLALLSIDSDDPADLDGKDRNVPHLLFGQRWVTEQTNHVFVKKVSEIDLLTETPEKWDSPTATPEPGIVSPGTKVRLSCQFNDADKVYYTIDGSDPTSKSPIYNWIASRWWNNRKDDLDKINRPIEINEDTVIKAVTMSNGKLDSDIATFEYKIETTAVTDVSIHEDDAYIIGETADGIKIMTVNDNQAGLKYFTVSIELIKAHEDTGTVVFTHIRDGVQLQLNALKADSDKVSTVKAGFNVKPGDVIKVYIVDKLTNDSDLNPVMLQ